MNLPTWCPECGPKVDINEDGCCVTCGASATGRGAVTAHLAIIERDEALAQVKELRAWQLAVAEGAGYVNRAEGQGGYEVASAETLVAAWKRQEQEATEAFGRGAEDMREACAQWVDHWVSGHVADKLRDMPIPEES